MTLQNLPYEAIGIATVSIVASVLIVVGSILSVALGYAVWVRFWLYVSNLMYRGYEPDGERPPLYKMRIAAITAALYRFEFRKIPAVWKEAERLADDDTTAKEALYGTARKLVDE